ncbi:MAG: DUF11 domain-containing protein [Thermoanaerobaculia bacterium]|nr:DUF11 domain-containing protein [Thermoanaerobaculia bacterium]
MPPGSSVTYTATCNIAPSATGSLANTATATASVTDPTPGNNSATDTDTLSREADIQITKDPTPSQVVLGGQTLNYVITITNNGPSDTAGVDMSDTLPGSVTFQAFQVPPPPGCGESLGVVSCTGLSLALGASVMLDFDVVVAMSPPLSIDNTASITATPDLDPDPNNNTATASVPTDQTPPEIQAMETIAGPLAGCGPTVRVEVSEISVIFSEELMASGGGPLGANDADNPANYKLFATGPDFGFSTTACGAAVGDDVPVSVDAVDYQVDTPMAPQSTAAVSFNGGVTLPDGLYRIMVCGASGIEDLAGNPLDGNPNNPGADDFVIDFRIDAGNLFRNGHLDCADEDETVALAPWQELPSAGIEVTRDSADSDGSPLSGSVVVASSGGTGFGIAQCVELGALDNPYVLSGRLLVDTSLSALLGFEVECGMFSVPACAGTPFASATAVNTLVADTNDTWTEWQADDVTLLPGTVSVRCDLVITNALAASFEVYLDQLRLEGAGLIFADGFESGDTSAWTAQVP